MVYRAMMEQMLDELDERSRRLNIELEVAPQGQLNIRTQKGKNYFTWRIPRTGNMKKARRYSITDEQGLIRKLVSKRYIEEALRRINNDIDSIEAALRKYEDISERSVMCKFIDKYPELEAGIYKDGRTDEVWAKSYRLRDNFFEEGLKSTAASGMRMRSKGELIIASRLDYFGVPYRYEAEVPHPDVNRVPDFTIRRPRDGKIIYWEHLGRTQDGEYMEDYSLKFVEYENAGITPWDNLIITYDKADGGLDVRIIDAMIRGWLL